MIQKQKRSKIIRKITIENYSTRKKKSAKMVIKTAHKTIPSKEKARKNGFKNNHIKLFPQERKRAKIVIRTSTENYSTR